MAENPAAMRELLERHLQPPPPGTYRVRDCRLAHVRRRDGSRFSAQYDVRFEDPETGRVWDRVVSGVCYGGGRTRRAWTSLPDPGPADRHSADGAALPPFAYVPELDLLVQVFPHDYRLPALARLVDGPSPLLLPAIIGRFGDGAWRIDGWAADLVRYRVDQRATLRLRVRVHDGVGGRDDEQEFFAKVYRDEHEGRRGRDAQHTVAEGAAAAGTPFAVAEPVVYDEEMRTLVQTAIAGTPLQTICRQAADPVPAVRAAARAVARFHRLDTAAPPSPTGDATGRLRNARDRLRASRPDLAAVISGLVDAVDAGLDHLAPSPIHGDLKPDHVLFDGDRPALIDFDLLATGDPLRDVANMVVHLARSRPRASHSGDVVGTSVRAFIEEYLAHAPAASRARLAAVPYRADPGVGLEADGRA